MKWIKNKVDIDKIRDTVCGSFECKCNGTAVCDGFQPQINL